LRLRASKRGDHSIASGERQCEGWMRRAPRWRPACKQAGEDLRAVGRGCH
jgi:hypothetical protein